MFPLLGTKPLSELQVYRTGGGPVKTRDLSPSVPVLMLLLHLQRRALAGLPLWGLTPAPSLEAGLQGGTSCVLDLLSPLSLVNPFPVALAGVWIGSASGGAGKPELSC